MSAPLPIGVAGPLPAPTTTSPASAPEGKSAPPDELVEAAREFEALILGIMMKSMRSTVNKSDLFGDTKHVETYESLLDTEYAKGMAEQGGMGFAEMIVRQYGSGPDGAQDLRRAVSGLSAAQSGYEAYGDAAVAAPMPATGGTR